MVCQADILSQPSPGQPLPELPQPTHSKYPLKTGLKPWVTINQAIASIKPGWNVHDPQGAQFQEKKSPHSGDVQAKCITTSGGIGNWHPSGLRGYTKREEACLQTFPMEHMFIAEQGVTKLRKQIGNAVPPIFAKLLFQSVVQSLRKSDGLPPLEFAEEDLAVPSNGPSGERQVAAVQPGQGKSNPATVTRAQAFSSAECPVVILD